MQQALTTAQANGVGLTLIYGRQEHGGSIWGFYFMDQSGRIIEREIDGTNKLIFTKVIDDIQVKPGTPNTGGSGGGSSQPTTDAGKASKLDPNVLNTLRSKNLTKLPPYRYLEIAAEKLSNPATKYVVENGDPMKIVVSSKGGGQVVMDMTTGKIISSK